MVLGVQTVGGSTQVEPSRLHTSPLVQPPHDTALPQPLSTSPQTLPRHTVSRGSGTQTGGLVVQLLSSQVEPAGQPPQVRKPSPFG